MHKIFKPKSAFTIIEIITVVVIIGIIAAFALPNFNKSLEKGRYRNARLNVIAIHSALKIYFAQNGTYLPAAADLDTINSNLDINIVDNDFDYSYVATATTFSIAAARVGLNYTITADQDSISDTNPTCSGPDCP